ncbi:MAG TPA: hypothetical protein VD763_09635 [Candidatus Saccharimonadales bacterium]|nr:hypothetical protein [Candidatus Saccharimonadales bacterium]
MTDRSGSDDGAPGPAQPDVPAAPGEASAAPPFVAAPPLVPSLPQVQGDPHDSVGMPASPIQAPPPLVPSGAPAASGGAERIAHPLEESPPAAPAPPARSDPIPPLSTARGLLGASFDLLTRSSSDMRRASFYIGAIVLGTVGPLALASWGIEVRLANLDFDDPAAFEAFETFGVVDVGLAALAVLAILGIVVAAVESRTLAASVLGGAMSGRPVTTRQALARSRMTFWRAIVASLVVAVPIAIVQAAIREIVVGVAGEQEQFSVVTSTLVTAVVGAPFAYLLAGIVLGDVDPFEGIRRSIRVFQARKLAAAVVAGFETVAALLIVLGLGTGLDLMLRVLDALGLGTDSGTMGLAVVTMLVVAAIFAFGTLLFTVYALTVAPQVVMFVGLTHATNGLDRVRAGGADDPDGPGPGRRPFRWLTRPMVLGFVLGGIGLAVVMATVTG